MRHRSLEPVNRHGCRYSKNRGPNARDRMSRAVGRILPSFAEQVTLFRFFYPASEDNTLTLIDILFILIIVNMTDDIDYKGNTAFFKAMGDENRLKIIDMLSRGEICACEILVELEITQSTLSHHMRILCDCSLVNARKDGKWTYYSLNNKTIKAMKIFINKIAVKKERIIINGEGCCL